MAETTDPHASAGFPPIPLSRAIVVLVCFVVLFFFLQGVNRSSPTPIVRSLGGFPSEFGPYRLKAVQHSSAAVVDMLGVTDYVSYRYRAEDGRFVSFYAAYYDEVNEKKGYHSPKHCLPGSGWGIAEVRPKLIQPLGGQGGPVEVAEMLIRNRNDYQVVNYWYQNRGRIISSEYWERVYRVLDSLLLRRSDGSFIRIIVEAPEGQDIESAKRLAGDFAARAMVELERFLPGR